MAAERAGAPLVTGRKENAVREQERNPHDAGRFRLDFLKTETAAGLALAIAAAAALILANSPLAPGYFAFIGREFTIQFGAFDHTESVLDWTKEGLMAVFFFIVGLEIKNEVLAGELSNPRKLALPVIAAIGGMAVPAAIYMAINAGPGGVPQGWAIPVATDIAFAVGALAILGRGLPSSLRIFLLTLAIADDLGAVALIAILFSENLQLVPLACAAGVLLLLAVLSRLDRAGALIYGVGFLVIWAFTLEGGVSTSLAGVATALTVPLRSVNNSDEGLLEEYMDSLHPYVAFGVLPFFAFVAAGFSFAGLDPASFLAPLPLGIAAGLVVGKTVGVFLAAWLAARVGLATRPSGATWLQVLGVSALCGIGFTMSLFIGGLTFGPEDALHQTQMRIGVIGGSLASLALGGLILALARPRRVAAGAAAGEG